MWRINRVHLPRSGPWLTYSGSIPERIVPTKRARAINLDLLVRTRSASQHTEATSRLSSKDVMASMLVGGQFFCMTRSKMSANARAASAAVPGFRRGISVNGGSGGGSPMPPVGRARPATMNSATCFRHWKYASGAVGHKPSTCGRGRRTAWVSPAARAPTIVA